MVNEQIRDAVQSFISTIPEQLGLKEIYIFGTESNNNTINETCPDLALIFYSFVSYHDIANRMNQLMQASAILFNLHILDENEFNSENPLAWQILQNGIEFTVGKSNRINVPEASQTQTQL
jgi:hypothetical protein